ncbi:methyltransferase domain-containing protein [Haloplanus natans]|uniref:methyltransferase domain-containing protein n=1 Tax=Haloplanus natans TaxID=376171 RepID=UPI000677A170|nr:methyltransferase domain-containing protein [Haloplanus natans]
MPTADGRRRVYGLELAGEDDAFAAREAACAATAVDVIAPGLATARGVDEDRLRTLAYTHRASRLLGRCVADIDAARAAVEAATIDRSGTVAVRARDVRGTAGIDTRRAERELGTALVDRGFVVDLDAPDHELRACFAGDTCLLGWLVAESVRDYGNRKPTDRPFFQPGSMAPLDARAFVNLVGAEPGATVLDPMCGTGGTLIEAGLVGSRPIGIDAQRKMVYGASENCRAYLDDYHLCRGDATALPLVDDAVDGVVFDAPYGRQSKIARHSLADLVSGALAEAARVAPRAVVVADRSWREAAEDAGWTVEASFERPVHRSLTRHVHLLER